jgi:hypothetical protein
VWGHINPGGVEMQYKIAGINPQLEHHASVEKQYETQMFLRCATQLTGGAGTQPFLSLSLSEENLVKI